VSNAVHILSNGTWVAPGPVIFRHPAGRLDPVAIAMNFFLVEAGGQRILIDTGMDGLDAYIPAELREPLGLGERGTTGAELGRLGLVPDDIDMVVLTHLHFDHCANIDQFRRARILVNAKEWRFVSSPGAGPILSRTAFPRQPLAYLMDEAWDRLETIDGTQEIAPGVTAIWTGGHTPGHMMVTVQTGSGLVVLPGDEIALLENLEADIPIGGFHDIDRVVAAMRLVRSMGGEALPVHEPKVWERHPQGLIR
jgi:N-acyl homoserine lactone hydrolase